MHIKEIDKLRVCDLFLILVCNSYESERTGKAVDGESVESISFFMTYVCLHYTHFPIRL